MLKSFFQLLRNMTEKGFFHLLSANVFIQVAGFASQFVVAWVLQPSDLGRIKILQTYTNLASILAGLGFNTSVLKLCSETGPLLEKRFLFWQGVKYTAIGATCVLALFNATNYVVRLSDDPQVVWYLYLYSPVLVMLAVTNLQNAYFQALKEIRLLSIIQVVTKSATLGVITLLTVFLGLSGYIMAAMVGSVLTVVLAFIRITKLHESTPSEQSRGVAVVSPFAKHWQYAKYSLLSNIIYQVFLATDIILLNNMVAEREAIGYYSFALTILIPFEVLRGTVVQMVSPYFSEKAGQGKEFNRVFQKYDRMLKLLAIGLAAVSLVVIPSAIHLLFVGKYDASIPYFRILIIAWTVRCFYCLKSVGLLGLGRIEVNFLASSCVLTVSLTVSYFLIGHWGTRGAALGSLFGEAVLMCVLGVVYRKVKPQW